MGHKFHIPVLGLGYSIDTPLKVARYGISSAISIVDDELVERIREYHTKKNGLEYIAIPKSANDYRGQEYFPISPLCLLYACANKQCQLPGETL